MSVPWDWNRRCTGGASRRWCGLQATVVCTELTGGAQETFASEWEDSRQVLTVAVEQLGPLQWYACAEPEHQRSPRPAARVRVKPLEQFFAELAELRERRELDRQKRYAADVLGEGPVAPQGPQGPRS